MNRVLRYSSLPLIWYLLSIGTIATTTLPVSAQSDRSSQLAQADVVRVTDVRVEQTATGVNLIFTTANGAALIQPILTTSDRTFIAEFANTTLTLPQGQTFQATAPAPGIELVTVEVIASNKVQVKIVGKNEVPVANIQANPNGLVLAISSPAEPEELEITVIATRSAENPRNVPQSITKIDRQQIQKQIAVSRDLGDALSKLVPGLAPPNERNNLFGQTLRGRNVTVLIDGIPQATTPNVFRDLQTIDPELIERIEVLRGPTAIYGDGATGGVINLITRTPSPERSLSTTQIGATTSLTGLKNSLGQTVQQTFSGTENNFGYVLSGGVSRIGSLYDATGNRIALDPSGQGGLSDARATNLFGKLTYNPDPNQQFVLSVSQLDTKQDPGFTSDPIVNTLPGRQRARVLEGLDLQDLPGTENSVVNLEYTNRDLLGSKVKGQVYYRNVLARFFPFDGRAFASLGGLIFQSRVESQRLGTRLGIETPLTSDGGVNLVWGLDSSRENSQQPVAFFDPVAFSNGGGLVFRKAGDRIWTPPLAIDNLGLFGQLRANVGSRLILRGGVRYESASVSVNDFTTLANNSVTGGKVNYDAALFNLGATYQINPQVSAFASFAQGFSLADIGRVLRAAPNNFQFARVRPEPQKVNNYEIGLRGEWDNVRSSISGFYSTSSLGTTFNSTFVDIIRAPEQIYGVEATLDYQPSKIWNLGLSASLAEGEIDTNNDGSYESSLDSFRITPLKLTAYVENQTSPGWSNRLQLLYSGTRNRFNNSTAFGRQAVSDYLTVDLLSSIKIGDGTLQVGVENLLNTDYLPVVSQLQTSDTQYLPGKGRSLSVRYGLSW